MWHSVWNDAGALNRLAAALALVAFLALAIGAIRHVASRPAFAIKNVVVSPKLANVDPAHVSAVIQQELRGTFFTLDLVAARTALGRLPWVRNVEVRRRWPARIEVGIEEHEPLARWNEVALVNTHGEVFDAEYGEELPDFYGPDGAAAEVTARYREFAVSIARSPVAIESLSRSARGAWDVKLDDGVTIALGREQVGERWARWVQVSEIYRNRIAQGKALAAVDMRYAHGFAARVAGGDVLAAARTIPAAGLPAAAKPTAAKATTGNKPGSTAAVAPVNDSTLISMKSAAKG